MLKTTFVVLSLSLAAVLAGCGEEPIPAEPSFATDVRPIMIARCVRCHGGGGMLNGDPTFDKGNPPPNGYFAQYEETTGACGPMDPPAGCKQGALFYARLKKLFTFRFTSTAGDRMPPRPAEPLTDHQIQIIERWVAQATPKP